MPKKKNEPTEEDITTVTFMEEDDIDEEMSALEEDVPQLECDSCGTFFDPSDSGIEGSTCPECHGGTLVLM